MIVAMQTTITALFAGWLASYVLLRWVCSSYEDSSEAARDRLLSTVGLSGPGPSFALRLLVALLRMASWGCFSVLVAILVWRIAGRL